MYGRYGSHKTQGEAQWYSRLDGNCNRNWSSICYLPLRLVSFFFMVSAVLSLLPPFYSWYWLASWNSTQASFLLVNSFLFAFQGFYDLIAWVFPQQRKWCLSCFSLVFHFPNFSFMRTIGPAFLFKPRSLATEWMDFSWVRWLLLIQRAGTGEY